VDLLLPLKKEFFRKDSHHISPIRHFANKAKIAHFVNKLVGKTYIFTLIGKMSYWWNMEKLLERTFKS